ncbi:glycoside hydrolase family 76 protein [Macrolepiota fuliginosa MF-IS2]|uniref:Glycoside hydrolase family 76 protein n=1 Tax=Macrolepiota fuliginosa MF-IS2 TaxID=1400762 RepID=A0A9P6C8L4_9AGAR|nr:glycoside hydrolase family 76 protein [Macrolepiota fuliginosa MF-IS2]
MARFLTTAFVFLATISAGFASPQKRQCQATLDIALSVAQRLQSHYFNAANGQYTGGSLWTDANTVEDLHNLMLARGSDDFSTIGALSTIGRAALANADWASILNGSNDDAGWIVLALWKIADYKSSRGQDPSPYNNAASNIYNIIAGQWDNTCGGGETAINERSPVWWSTAHTYKNAITNELFLLTSANGYLRNNNPTYLDNAQKTWNWLKASGMRNSDGLWNDGLDFNTCQNNGQRSLDATIQRLTNNNILKESCDNAASGGAVCNQDQGLWTKHLQYYLDMANDSTRTAKYSPFLGSQTSAVFHFGTNADNDVGSVWYAPNQGGSIFTPKTSASGLEAHVSAAKYGPC